MSAQLTNALESLIEKWKQRAHVAAAIDAMLINKHIRELTEALRMAEAALRAQGEPDMFWNDADPERCRDSIAEVIEYEWSNADAQVGDTMEIQQAIRLPNIKIRITADATDEDGFDFEVIDEAPHPQGEEHGG